MESARSRSAPHQAHPALSVPGPRTAESRGTDAAGTGTLQSARICRSALHWWTFCDASDSSQSSEDIHDSVLGSPEVHVPGICPATSGDANSTLTAMSSRRSGQQLNRGYCAVFQVAAFGRRHISATCKRISAEVESVASEHDIACRNLERAPDPSAGFTSQGSACLQLPLRSWTLHGVRR